MILSASEWGKPYCKDLQMTLLSTRQNLKTLARPHEFWKIRFSITHSFPLFYAIHVTGNTKWRQHIRPSLLGNKGFDWLSWMTALHKQPQSLYCSWGPASVHARVSYPYSRREKKINRWNESQTKELKAKISQYKISDHLSTCPKGFYPGVTECWGISTICV